MNNLLRNKRSGLLLLAVFLLSVALMSLQVSHINLMEPVSDLSGVAFSAMTDSAGHHGFAITLVVLIALSWHLVRYRLRFVTLMAQLGLLLVVGFAAKTGLKQMTESPRPYTELLTQQLLIPEPSHFYKLNDQQQAQMIEQISAKVSPWRTQHWQGEKDYSFPSGHTIFAAICLVFFGSLFIEHRRYLLTAALGGWALMVAYSRLWIGMHRPIDLIGSIVFVGLVYILMPNVQRVVERLFSGLPLVRHHG
ncbi:phosphatase PAP2 family protein [Vibrio sinaloensis]|uniref:phosphatase PAP2 family protein n=1 Tax=Photobacterium sp. (strain ATCC 43367) TaxID=379097 RepID=UPI002068443C|nr:phosphatase PAP2 family protein [Vibrio sinaloensis]UPQ89410.1 phosphatase PAP2 family protein [Vibrio sinaloensis]